MLPSAEWQGVPSPTPRSPRYICDAMSLCIPRVSGVEFVFCGWGAEWRGNRLSVGLFSASSTFDPPRCCLRFWCCSLFRTRKQSSSWRQRRRGATTSGVFCFERRELGEQAVDPTHASTSLIDTMPRVFFAGMCSLPLAGRVCCVFSVEFSFFSHGTPCCCAQRSVLAPHHIMLEIGSADVP